MADRQTACMISQAQAAPRFVLPLVRPVLALMFGRKADKEAERFSERLTDPSKRPAAGDAHSRPAPVLISPGPVRACARA
ncbi:hypothetical protein AOLI_G00320690 [Acnodon oligacanthus]